MAKGGQAVTCIYCTVSQWKENRICDQLWPWKLPEGLGFPSIVALEVTQSCLPLESCVAVVKGSRFTCAHFLHLQKDNRNYFLFPEEDAERMTAEYLMPSEKYCCRSYKAVGIDSVPNILF